LPTRRQGPGPDGDERDPCTRRVEGDRGRAWRTPPITLVRCIRETGRTGRRCGARLSSRSVAS
jgi:hypothetical protein